MATKATYHELASELETILAALQQDDTDVDTALQQYERGLELVAALEAQIASAENTVTELKAKFSTDV